MVITRIDIDLSRFRGKEGSTIFTGRPQGVEARKTLKLDDIDQKENVEAHFLIPGDTTSFNPSFYLGLLYNSIKLLNDKFPTKYYFDIQSEEIETKRVLEKNLDDAFKSAKYAMGNKNPFAFLS